MVMSGSGMVQKLQRYRHNDFYVDDDLVPLVFATRLTQTDRRRTPSMMQRANKSWSDSINLLPALTARGAGYLALAFLTTSCLPAKKSLSAAASAGASANIDKSKYPEVKSSRDAYLLVAKRMMGVDPSSGDKQNHIGLTNLGDMLGFKYPFNDCGASFEGSVSKDAEVSVFAPHANGSSDNCKENDNSAPVHYTFKDWTVLSNSTYAMDPYSDASDKSALPVPSSPGAGAQVVSGDAQASIVDGRLVVITPEVVSVTGTNNTTDPQTLTVDYTRMVSTEHAVSFTQTISHGVDTQISVGAEGGLAPFAKVSTQLSTAYKFSISKANSQQTTTTQQTTVHCSSTVSQKPGCSYTLKIAANYVQTKGRYIGYIQARPNVVGLSGKLNDKKDCQNKKYRKHKGTCNGEKVEETFGSDSVTFDADLKNRISGGDGNWYWQSLASLPSQRQDDGKANIDILTDYLSNGDYDKFAMRFEDVTESITACKAVVEVTAGGDNCRISPPTVNTSAN